MIEQDQADHEQDVEASDDETDDQQDQTEGRS